jgi:hypothetical protein
MQIIDIDEPEEKDLINVGLLKQLTSSDTFFTRSPHYRHIIHIPCNIIEIWRLNRLTGVDLTKQKEYIAFLLLKKIHHSLTRKKRLNFCDQLDLHSSEFRYRPNGVGYLELKLNNRGKFADL